MTLKSLLGLFGKGDGEPDKGDDWNEKRGGHRLELGAIASLSASLQVPIDDERATVIAALVTNVSMRGCRLEFVNAADRDRLYVAQILLASLDVQGFSIPLHLEVVRLSGTREAAVRFKAPFPRELERLEKFIEPRSLGRSLREIDPAALQRTTEVGKGLRWFQGANETNLFSWLTSSGHVVQQQLIFLDCVVEWKAGEAARTGRVRGETVSAGRGWVPTDLLDFDKEPDADVMAKARTMILAAEIDPVIRDAFLNQVR